MSFVQEITGATVAGCTATVVGHPLDTLKVHLQTNPKLANTYQATKWLFRHNSPTVLFHGISPPLFNAILMNTVMFSVFNSVKNASTNVMGGPFLAGAISGFATAAISTPTDYVKIQSQLWGVSSAHVLRSTLLKNPCILFRGHVANLCREGLFTTVYLGLYDVLKESVSGRQQVHLSHVALLSSLTGAAAWVVSYPFDTIKSIQQGSEKHLTMRSAARKIFSHGGYRSFYKGCGASTGRAVLVTMIRLVSYEWIAMRLLGNGLSPEHS